MCHSQSSCGPQAAYGPHQGSCSQGYGQQQQCCHAPFGMMSKKSRLEMLKEHREELVKRTQEVDELVKEIESE